ncbi:MAG: hypothetical protein K2X87_31560 [Gemmataceae bacterium]|nr:hypothetical protein [Gemmataceae bacterium]
MNAIPEPTADEQYLFDVHIGSWGDRTPIQRGVGLGVIRGHDSLPKLERYLGLPESVLQPELMGLWGGLLWEDAGKRIQLS